MPNISHICLPYPRLQVIGMPGTYGAAFIESTEAIDELIDYLQAIKTDSYACLYANTWDFEVKDDWTADCQTGEWSTTIESITGIPVGVNIPIAITINGSPATFTVSAVTLTPLTGAASVGANNTSINIDSVLSPNVPIHISGNIATPFVNGDTLVITITDNNTANNSRTHTANC